MPAMPDVARNVVADDITWLMVRAGLEDSLTPLQAAKGGDLDGTVWAGPW